MFERFTDTARHVVVQAQADARRLGHNYIGCEHLLLAAAATGEPASAALRDQGVTPERIEAEILRTIGRGETADPLGGLDREALASIGVDLEPSVPDRGGVRPGRPQPGPPGRLPEQTASLGEGAAGRADAPSASASRPSQRPAARRPARQRLASPGSGSPRPYPVHSARQEEPGALAARGEGAERHQHRRPAPHPGPARHERRYGPGDPVGPRHAGRTAARRHPRPLPQGELTRA